MEISLSAQTATWLLILLAGPTPCRCPIPLSGPILCFLRSSCFWTSAYFLAFHLGVCVSSCLLVLATSPHLGFGKLWASHFLTGIKGSLLFIAKSWLPFAYESLTHLSSLPLWHLFPSLVLIKAWLRVTGAMCPLTHDCLSRWYAKYLITGTKWALAIRMDVGYKQEGWLTLHILAEQQPSSLDSGTLPLLWQEASWFFHWTETSGLLLTPHILSCCSWSCALFHEFLLPKVLGLTFSFPFYSAITRETQEYWWYTWKRWDSLGAKPGGQNIKAYECVCVGKKSL